MSEFSESYHVRTGDADATKKRLRNARLAGIVFGPQNGWLTFVPYENLGAYRDASGSEALTRRLSRLLDASVLHYRYAEDHGWTVALARPTRATVSRFACWWDPEPSVERDEFDLSAFASLAPVDAITPLLKGFNASSAFEQKPAYRFADLVGLPAYKWISPHLAQHHTADLIEIGGGKLGTKPSSAAEQLHVPPDRKLALPRPDLSAREALDLVLPFTSKFEAGWFLSGVGDYGGNIGRGGRLTTTAWQFTYAKGRTAAFIYVSLFHNGNLGFRGDIPPKFAPAARYLAAPLPSEWMDSTDVAEIIRGEPPPDGQSANYTLELSLRGDGESPLAWKVTRRWVEPRPVLRMSTHSFAVDATTGKIGFETYERTEAGKPLEARWRIRSEDSEWQTLGAS